MNLARLLIHITPLVEELKQLWSGFVMKTHDGMSVIVRCALICVSCDIPAAHKVCGFVSHNASLGCSKCLKHFPTSSFGEKPNFSGFDRNKWTLRTSEIHRQHAYLHKICNTLDSQRKIEREHGCRYSVPLELSYFDVVQMCIIDPMQIYCWHGKSYDWHLEVM